MNKLIYLFSKLLLKNKIIKKIQKFVYKYLFNVHRTQYTENLLENILGGNNEVVRLGLVWEDVEYSMLLLSSYSLMEFVKKEDFNKRDIEIYKKGLSDIPVLLELCKKIAIEDRENSKNYNK